MWFLVGFVVWGVLGTNTVVPVGDKVVCLRNEQLHVRRGTEGVSWGWNPAGTQSALDLGYSIDAVPPKYQQTCLEAIRRWGGAGFGIRIRLKQRPAGSPQTIVFRGEPFPDATLALAVSEFPHTGGPSSTIRFNTNLDWSRYSLLHVLIHEVGHALGLTHVRDEHSVMRSEYSGQEQVGWSDLVRASELYQVRFWPAIRHNPAPGMP